MGWTGNQAPGAKVRINGGDPMAGVEDDRGGKVGVQGGKPGAGGGGVRSPAGSRCGNSTLGWVRHGSDRADRLSGANLAIRST